MATEQTNSWRATTNAAEAECDLFLNNSAPGRTQIRSDFKIPAQISADVTPATVSSKLLPNHAVEVRSVAQFEW
jgi:hypothetical protein